MTTGTHAVETPLMGLGATGFSPAQREAIASALSRLGGATVRWRLVPFAEADAWWVNGRRMQYLRGGHVRVGAGLPTEHALHFDLDDVDRPLAFSLPVAAPEFVPQWGFHLDDDASVQPVLRQFERWLGLLRAQFALGALVMRLGASLRRSVQHVSIDGRLLAVLDYRQGVVGIHPAASAEALWAATWSRQEHPASGLPEGFVECSPAQLLWAYLRRTERELLPQRYRTDRIHFRHPPRVPLRWVRDSQLAVLRELKMAPATMVDLQQRTGHSQAVLTHDLSCLYYAGAITTTAAKAAPLEEGARASAESSPSVPTGALAAGGPSDPTAPAQLAAY